MAQNFSWLLVFIFSFGVALASCKLVSPYPVLNILEPLRNELTI